uniref:Uncharacterized protein n=1 Tax=Chromera velia CCMP2878 TaxID=1169474 RepID=A0A0G4GE84_9ALVE|mmetsp:Transcript_24869/g.48711  ORF Transcript_24869/g.48711 Transcript_24869/m.48711 type:complete len:136 (+) Transcript_24869:244-651(+)|eukprot:Cvel_21389.t1-p1 / transcript=Cvel_21389.t1 / gene=Cvel_21389 / organism=Chromera_velia_CCMP2878 / gene_product=hypothetical protein / transcript_product=hypothetical protein / location=Cvel_scaffold2002:16439-18628(-) / protein_length=135 / sequence_SO=supercontig / SO=protein_coding / is_pseudo=false
MAQSTVPPKLWTDLIWSPKSTGADPSVENLGSMRFDPKHFVRAYTLCRGSGRTDAQCKDSLDEDTYITPANPAETVFQKELVDGMVCMMTFRDDSKCQHFSEALYKKMHWEPPKPTTGETLKAKWKILTGSKQTV